VVAVAAEKNSTLVLPFPVELLRFLERAQQPAPPSQEQPSMPSPELFAQLQKLLAQPQQQLAEAKEPSAGSSSESPSESSSELERSVPSTAEQSLREQLPPVPEPFDLDSGGSKSGQV
jgi:hypothetical protein